MKQLHIYGFSICCFLKSANNFDPGKFVFSEIILFLRAVKLCEYPEYIWKILLTAPCSV